MNRLSSKGMTNAYLEDTIEKKWQTQNFSFLSLNSSCPVHVFGKP